MGDETKGLKARSDIMDAAMALFLSKGYAATSLRDIAAASGNRAVGGIYNHFENKQAIFRALIETRNPYEELLPIIEAGEGDTAPEFLRNVLRRVLPLLTRHYDFIQLVQIDAREFGSEHTAQLIRESVLPRIMTAAQRVLSLPGLKPLEPAVFIRMMVTIVAGYALTQQVAPRFIIDLLPAEMWIERYIDTLLYGIAASQP